MVTTVQNRIATAIKHAETSWSAAAIAIGLSAQAPAKWKKGQIGNDTLKALAQHLKVSYTWLLTGEGEMLPTSSNVRAQGVSRQVPLISWVAAGEFCEAIDNFSPGEAEEWFDCPVPSGKNTYCLEIVGQSMYVPDGSGYSSGEIIFVDPSRDVLHNSDVIVRNAAGKATFKRYQNTTDGEFLIALNPNWPDRIIHAPEGTVFCGVVIFSGKRRG